ncbi:MAG: arsenate reductase ArsC [Myxococcota bacterium]|jgi:arsenate reductase|nr:arsenate reductase ArsC [Myxococcota bacterium]
MIEAAVLRALRPRGVLFLCVANSARSQLAEGIARSLAPPGIAVFSAGSEPSSVRPEAVEVLAEIDIDIGSHHSKAIDTVDRAAVDTVITLCADEVCPVYLAQARRARWGLPDPAAVEGGARLDAFRAARDELRARLALLLHAP